MLFPPQTHQSGERWSGNHVAWDAGFFVYYKTYVNVSPFGLGFAFSPWLLTKERPAAEAALTLPGTCRDL